MSRAATSLTKTTEWLLEADCQEIRTSIETTTEQAQTAEESGSFWPTHFSSEIVLNSQMKRANMTIGMTRTTTFGDWLLKRPISKIKFLVSESSRHAMKTWRVEHDKKFISGSRQYLPASAIDGAAIAFGLETLLPLNIPAKSPLMYCKSAHELRQNQIKLNGRIYSCENGGVLSAECDERDSCDGNGSICNNNSAINEISCINGTLYSRVEMFCNESDAHNHGGLIRCFIGQLPNDTTSFIPTIRPAVRQSGGQSGFAKFANFFLDLVGLASDEEETTEKTTQSKWIPKALEIPAAPITTPEPHIYLVKSNDNTATWHYYRSLSDIYLRSEKLKVPMSSFERNNVRTFTITEYNRMKENGEVVDF